MEKSSKLQEKQKSEFFLQDTFNNKYSQMLKLNSCASDNEQQYSSQKSKDKNKQQDDKVEQKQTRIKILDQFQKSYLLNRKKSNISEYSINLQSSIIQPRNGSIINQHDSRSRSKSPINKQNFYLSKSTTSKRNNPSTQKYPQINNKSNKGQKQKQKQAQKQKSKIKSTKPSKKIEQEIDEVKQEIQEELFLIELQQNVHKHLIELLKLKDKGKKLIKESTNQKMFELYDQIGEYVDSTEGYVSSMTKLQKFVQ